MIFQGKELHIGDKLVSKMHGEILVSSMHRKFFTATTPGSGQTYEWDYEGCYCYVGDNIIDASWPDVSTERPPIPFAPNPQPRPEREAEYRRIWIERAARLFDGDIYVEMIKDGTARDLAMSAFDAADAFLVELKKRDGANNGTD